MLLNFTHHPSKNWHSDQIAEASNCYGGVKDLPFPIIPPDIDEKGLDILVEEYYQRIIELAPAAVHIMGEMTFTCRMVSKLKDAGISCIASTTDRIVTEEKGKKIVEFKFVRFRKY
ncbi:MAG: hypothetical protein Kow0027_22740 [Saprospiraceae bacterium]